MHKQLNRKIFIILLLVVTLFTVLPGVVSADTPPAGPAIRIGDPTCQDYPAYVFVFIRSQYTHYDPATEKCLTVSIFTGATVRTDSPVDSSNTDVAQVGLKPINFPTFLDVSTINHFSVWSYVAFIVTLIFTLMIIYWVVLLLRAAIAVMHSEGDPKTFESARKKMTSVIMGIVFLVGFFVLINLVAGFLGVGNFSEWPKVFSLCRDGRYYYVVKLETEAKKGTFTDSMCF